MKTRIQRLITGLGLMLISTGIIPTHPAVAEVSPGIANLNYKCVSGESCGGGGSDTPPGGGGGGSCSPSLSLNSPDPGSIRGDVQLDYVNLERMSQPAGFSLPTRLPGQTGVPAVSWNGPGVSGDGTTGPTVTASVNGGPSSIFLGNGASIVNQTDLGLTLQGVNYAHTRSYSSLDTATGSYQGEQWWTNEMMNISCDVGTEGDTDCDVTIDPHHIYHFTNTATDTWTTDDNFVFSLSFTSGSDEYTFSMPNGFKYVFHDMNVTNIAGMLKRQESSYGNTQSFVYSGADLDYIDVDVVAGTDHRIDYSYFTSGDSNGLLQYIKAYKSTTTTSANLIGQVEYVYHSSTADAYGSEDDLMKVIVSHKATADGDGVLSISDTYHYRYYKGTYNATTNPGTDHHLRYVLFPENGDRLNTDIGDPLTQSNADFEDYANVYYKYASDSRVKETQERLAGSSGCGCGGAGGTVGITTYAWTINTGTPNLDTWMVHCVADRNDDSRVIFDVNRWYQLLTWVVQDEDDGSPTRELVWHYDYGTSGSSENRLTKIYNQSRIVSYDESTYAVTLTSGFPAAGLEYNVGYDSNSYPSSVNLVSNSRFYGQVGYSRTITERPDLATTIKHYESLFASRDTTLTYTFYDAGKIQLKQMDVSYPVVSAATNGPATAAVEKRFFDKRTGQMRWMIDGEGYVSYLAFDDETGVQNLFVSDANTSTLLTTIDNTWDGVAHGGLAADDTVPFTRTGSGTALDIATTATIDWLGRTRKTTDAEGMIVYNVFKDNEKRTYRAWDEALLPIQIIKTDEDGRPEEILMLDASVVPSEVGGEPTGTESDAGTNQISRTVNIYSIAGLLESTNRYHNIPSSGDGTHYTNYYSTAYEYDDMGRTEYVISDVANESPQDREQVTQSVYDFLGRRIASKEAVSDNNHDISSSKPTMNTTSEMFYDTDTVGSQGEGDGNVRFMRKYYGTGGGEYEDTEFEFDARNRRTKTLPPIAPYSKVTYDNLDRTTISEIYSSTTMIAANRLDLSKNLYDERGRVYQRVRYDDPSDSTPADGLETNTYRDRRGLVWAVDAANSGISFTVYDGAKRRSQSLSGTQFDTAKYTSSAPDYPDDNEGIVRASDFTLDDAGNVQKTIAKELNHDDTDGMDLDGTDFVRSYRYSYYDAAHRVTDSVNHGTNNSDGFKDNSTAPTYTAGSPPTRSDTILVTSFTYDDAGRRTEVKDPKGIVTKSEYDELNQEIAKTEDSGSGTKNRKTEYEYNAIGGLLRIIADLDADNTFSNGSWTTVGSDVDQITEYAYIDNSSSHRITEIRFPTGDGTVGSTQQDKIVFTYNVDGTLIDRVDQNGSKLTWSYDELRRKTIEEVTTLGTYTGGNAAVDGGIRELQWIYDNEGRTEKVTSYTDTAGTTVANEIKYTYNEADKLTKEEQEVEGAVDGSTLSVQYGYESDYGTDNVNRRDSFTFPDSRKIRFGYTHSGGAGTYQDTINDTFNRIGQIGTDNAGSIGDIYAEYDFVGSGRFVRRSHTEDSSAGNDTRSDLWHGTTGHYQGLDRFGRVVDLKHTDYNGSDVDFFNRVYSYDRNGNRTAIEHVVFPEGSESFAYDDLNRLTTTDRGIIDTSESIQLSKAGLDYTMDDLGNFTGLGIKVNTGTGSSIAHTINATNEISAVSQSNSAGKPLVIEDAFSSTLNATVWTADLGTWSTASGKLNVDTLSSGDGVLLTEADFDTLSTQATITFPSGSSNKAGIILNHDGSNSYHAVVLDRAGSGKLALYKVTSGSWGSALKSKTVTIGTDPITVRVYYRQRRIVAWIEGDFDIIIDYDTASALGTGLAGFYSDLANVKFDDFDLYDQTGRDPLSPQANGWPSAPLIPDGKNFGSGGVQPDSDLIVAENFYDDDYLVQVDIDPALGVYNDVWVRTTDPNNGYRFRLMIQSNDVSPSTKLLWHTMKDGRLTHVGTHDYGFIIFSTQTLRLVLSGTTIKAYLNTDSSPVFNGTHSDHTNGTVVFTAVDIDAFSNIKIGYDNSDPLDNDLLDAGDDVVYDKTDFTGTSTTITHDHAGNLIVDGSFVYIYDAWNRLVAVKSQEDTDITIQTAEFDATGRRIRVVVTNSGDLSAETRYYYDGWKIAETRVGASPTTYHQQFIHGTQYIDEVVMVRAIDKGDLYIHQDANWNVIGTSDLAASLVERNVYTPYGQLTVHQETSYGDRDGDGDVDSTDKGTPGSTCTGTVTGACRILDLDFDGDYDSTDADNFDLLTQGIARHQGRTAKSMILPFSYEGLLIDKELETFQSRYRQLAASGQRRFLQRDPIANLTSSVHMGYKDGLNLFAFARNNPISRTDPMGLVSICGSPQSDDWHCCPQGWGSGSKALGLTKCCAGGKGTARQCWNHACLNPAILSMVGNNFTVVQCVIDHECEHMRTRECSWPTNPMAMQCCWNTEKATKEQKECSGYQTELNCLLSKTPPTDIHSDKRCNFTACMAQELCPTYGGNRSESEAVAECSKQQSAGWPGRSGCSDPLK